MKKLTTRDTMSTNQESGQAILRTGSAGRDGVRQTASMTHSQILTKLYEPITLTQQDDILFFDAKELVRAETKAYVRGIPVPRSSLRVGYGSLPEEFLETARSTASLLRAVMKEQNVVLDRDTAVGCATGQALQGFLLEAEKQFSPCFIFPPVQSTPTCHLKTENSRSSMEVRPLRTFGISRILG